MSDINGQENISVSFYNSLLGVGDGQADATPREDPRQVRMQGIPADYGTMDRLIDETDARVGRTSQQEQSVAGLTRRLAEMFEQKKELADELRSERLRLEQVESERDDLQRQVDQLTADCEQARAQVEQTQAARERATKFIEDAREKTYNVINESRMKVADSEEARAEAQRAYEDEHNIRRNLEQLLQEKGAEIESMSDRITVLSGELSDATRAKEQTERELADARMDIETMRAEAEAHTSRIDHLTGRNELLARNLQSINAEHGELRKQFDATAVSQAALSADYEALVRRCNDAESERDRLRLESIERSSVSAEEMDGMRQEVVRARSVISLLRPIISKAGAGSLKRGDIRILDERLSEYEQASLYSQGSTEDSTDGMAQPDAVMLGGQAYDSVAEPITDVVAEPIDAEPAGTAEADGTGDSPYDEWLQPTYETDATDGVASEAGAGDGFDSGIIGNGYSAQGIESLSTEDLYAMLDLAEAEDDAASDADLGAQAYQDEGDDEDTPVESVSFVDMFGKPQDDGDTGSFQATPGASYEVDDFDDLDEPDLMDDMDGMGVSAASPEAASATNFDFEVSDIFNDDDASGEFAFPEDLKRSDTQQSDAGDTGSDDMFDLGSLSEFDALMADFARYGEPEAAE